MATTLHHWTNGAIFEGTGGRFSDVTNPATGEVTAQLALASEADVETRSWPLRPRPTRPGGTPRWPGGRRCCSRSASC